MTTARKFPFFLENFVTMNTATFLCLFLVVAVANGGAPLGRRRNLQEKRTEILDDPRYVVEWQTDFDAGTVEFEVRAQTTGFVGFGLSVSGTMNGADIVIGGVRADGSTYFSDYHGTGNQRPLLDDVPNWELLSATEVAGLTTLRFRRPLETCDAEQDEAITAGTVKLIWALGAEGDDDIHGHTPTTRGALAVNMLDPPFPPVDLEDFDMETVAMQYELLEDDTVYWCTIHKRTRPPPPEGGDGVSHIVAFKPILGTPQALKHTHHFNMYTCKGGPTLGEELAPYIGVGRDCHGDYRPRWNCSNNLYAWSFGGRLLVFPDDIGFPWGYEEDEYFLFEAHFDNPELETGKVIDTGVEIYHTPVLREHEAGMLSVGHGTTPSLMIPPATDDWTLVGHCSSGCTQRAITGAAGIQIFNANLHAHKSGRKMKLRHFREGQELPWLAKDYTYDFDFQENRPLAEPVHVLPGDHLSIECTFDSNWRRPTSAVIGGISTQDEMCMAFLFYYPRVPLEACFSGYSIPKLMERLGVEEVTGGYYGDPVIVRPEKWATLRWSEFLTGNVSWTEEAKKELQEELRFGEHDEMCSISQNNGDFGAGKKIGLDGVPLPGLLNLPQVSYPEFEKEYEEPAAECLPGGGNLAVPSIFVLFLGLLVHNFATTNL